MDLFGDLPDPVTNEDKPFAKENGSKRKIDSDSNFDEPVVKKPVNNVEQSDDIPNTSCEPLFRLQSCTAARKGERDEMQDAHTAIDNFHPQLKQISVEVSRVAFYGVYDGHAGLRASQFAAKRLHLIMAEKFPRGSVEQISKDIKRIMFEVYKDTDKEFLKEAAKIRPHWKDGSTAVTALVVNNTLYIANIGDSKIVLGRESADGDGKLTSLCLSRDHNPVDYEERQRIQRAGGVVREGRVAGILEVSRSFGDYQFKKQGVTCIPDVRKCTLTPRDRFMIIACDGLWKSFTPDEAVSVVSKVLSDGTNGKSDTKNPSGDTNSSLHSLLHTACNKLANEAVLKLSGDNVTVMIVHVKH